MRLIDADALIALVKKHVPFIYHMVVPIVAITHTIDAEPVRHGYWTEDGCCSECGEMGLYNGNEEIVRSRYCPHCGTKMDAKEG